MQRLIDQRIEELLEDPTSNPHLEYDDQYDQWSVPVGADGEGFITYSVVDEPRPVVIVLRLVYAGSSRGV